VQFDDVVANGVGVLAGTCLVAAFALCWKAVSGARTALRR
jgi:hypothetical protein